MGWNVTLLRVMKLETGWKGNPIRVVELVTGIGRQGTGKWWVTEKNVFTKSFFALTTSTSFISIFFLAVHGRTMYGHKNIVRPWPYITLDEQQTYGRTIFLWPYNVRPCTAMDVHYSGRTIFLWPYMYTHYSKYSYLG